MFQGLHPSFTERLQALFAAVPGLRVTSGYRSYQEQAVLWNKYGRNPRRVAPPGRSMHNFGLAADITGPPEAMRKAHELAPRFGLRFPMSWEPWHIEPLEGRGLAGQPGGQGGGLVAIGVAQPEQRPVLRIPAPTPTASTVDDVIVMARHMGIL